MATPFTYEKSVVQPLVKDGHCPEHTHTPDASEQDDEVGGAGVGGAGVGGVGAGTSPPEHNDSMLLESMSEQ